MDITVQDLTEVTELADDDYVVIDSSEGDCKILATDLVNILNGGA